MGESASAVEPQRAGAGAGAGRLIVFYVLFFMSIGVTLPFMPQYFRSLGLRPSEIGVLLAVGPTLALFAPPLWGQLADRTGRPGLVLVVLSAGGLLGYSLLSQASSFLPVLAMLALAHGFLSAITTLIDTLALHQVAAEGGTYARIRTFGSLGFVLGSLGFGFLVEVIDRTTVYVACTIMLAYTLWGAGTLARLPAMLHAGPRASFAATWSLLRQRGVALFLLATCLHWIACAPYHGVLSIHFTAVGLPPSAVSMSTAVAVTAELLVLVTWPRWGHRIEPRVLLLLSFAASALRWWAMAATDDAVLLAAISAIHGLTFGTFYVASVSFMSKSAPASLRATGQALYVAATFGVGGLVGFVGSGLGYEAVGGHRLFVVAGFVEVLPALVVLAASRRAPAPGAA